MSEALRDVDLGDGRRLHLVATGLNHRTAPVEVRERIAFGGSDLESALVELRERPAVAEAAILSTCNRAELYAVSPEPEACVRAITAFLGDWHSIDPGMLLPHLYSHTDAAAARHLFRVAAGLDSMVLGEGQILAQVRSAFQHASDVGTSRTFLNELFQRSLHIGKQARSETAIHRGAVSISSAAVDLAKQVFGDLKGRRALVVGAGEMSEQTLKLLVDQGVAGVVVANRTYQRAVELAGQYNGCAVMFDEFPEHLKTTDIVVSSSAAPHAILTVDRLRSALSGRRGRPLFIIDIAVPRDVEPQVADLPDVYLFDIDDLDAVASGYRKEREREVEKVEALVEIEIARFMAWLDTRGALPLIVELKDRIEAIRDAELDRWLRRMPHVGETERDLMRQMMRSFANKLMHGPLTDIRQHAGQASETEYTESIRRLFGLDSTRGQS